MFLRPIVAAVLGGALLVSCAKEDLAAKPEPLGDFALGLNVIVADNVQKVPISRDATVDEWEASMKKAIDDRFGRFEGTKLYNIGIAVDGYALAPPGIPVVAAPKSILVITANIWDDGAQKRLNEEGKQLTVFETLSGDTFIGSGLTRTKEEQMEALSFNAAAKVEEWLRQNPWWFGLPDNRPSTADAPSVASGATAAPVPAPVAPPVAPPAN